MNENNGFKEVNSLDDVEQTLKEIKKSWEEICDAFGVNPETRISPGAIRSSVRMTMVELNELENLEYVRKSGKKLAHEEVERMYKDNSQLRIEDFVFPYGTLDPENDWVKLAALVP